MSICANIIVLFKHAPDLMYIDGIEKVLANMTRVPNSRDPEGRESLSEVEGADLIADVNNAGELYWRGTHEQLYSPLIGGSRLQGRLFRIHYFSRFWSLTYPEGPLWRYSVTMLCLLSLPEIQGVWYAPDSIDDGCAIMSMTSAGVHSLIDEFVLQGMKS